MSSKWIAGREFDTREAAKHWARSGHAQYVIIDPYDDDWKWAMRVAIEAMCDVAWNEQQYKAMRILFEFRDSLDK